ncbi:MAG: rhodanese family protein [Tepidisphaeraceae bacterium]
MSTLSPADCSCQLNAGEAFELIDVRTPVEYAERHATGAKSVPLDAIEPGRLTAGRTPMLICKSGKRAAQAAEKLKSAGVDCVVVEGGTDAWAAAGLPVTSDKSVMSLERQVRIAAGLIVLAGVLLSVFVHPYFVWLSAFVGAGLAFAGITNTCGMAMVLAKMPWNARLGSGASCTAK